MYFDCEMYEKSDNKAEFKNIDSFTSFLRDSVNINIDKAIKPQAHSYLNKVQNINANYSGSKLITGSLKKSDKCFK
jgi:hypothetical protein